MEFSATWLVPMEVISITPTFISLGWDWLDGAHCGSVYYVFISVLYQITDNSSSNVTPIYYLLIAFSISLSLSLPLALSLFHSLLSRRPVLDNWPISYLAFLSFLLIAKGAAVKRFGEQQKRSHSSPLPSLENAKQCIKGFKYCSQARGPRQEEQKSWITYSDCIWDKVRETKELAFLPARAISKKYFQVLIRRNRFCDVIRNTHASELMNWL